MKTATTKKIDNLIIALHALIRRLMSTEEADRKIRCLCRTAPSTYDAVAKALSDEIRATSEWQMIHKTRRQRAERLHEFAVAAANVALDLGGSYSGETHRKINWEGPAHAATHQSGGDRYCRSQMWTKTDATHVVNLDPACLDYFERNSSLVDSSSADGLPLIALYPVPRQPDVYQAVWVANKSGKMIESTNGWIAYDRSLNLTCHSTVGASDAKAGLGLKREAFERERQHREALGETNPRELRRARLIARLCGNVTATVADARKLGFCNPGITAFRARHGIKATASLPELLRTEDPHAIKLALYIARKTNAANRKSKQ